MSHLNRKTTLTKLQTVDTIANRLWMRLCNNYTIIFIAATSRVSQVPRMPALWRQSGDTSDSVIFMAFWSFIALLVYLFIHQSEILLPL